MAYQYEGGWDQQPPMQGQGGGWDQQTPIQGSYDDFAPDEITIMTMEPGMQADAMQQKSNGPADTDGGYRKKAKIFAWVDIGFVTFVLVMLLLGCLLAIVMNQDTVKQEIYSEAMGVFSTIIFLFLTLQVWHDSCLIKATRPSCETAVSIEHGKYWLVYTCSQLVVNVLVIAMAATSLELQDQRALRMPKEQAIVALVLTSISIVFHLVSIFIVWKFIKEVKEYSGARDAFTNGGPEEMSQVNTQYSDLNGPPPQQNYY